LSDNESCCIALVIFVSTAALSCAIITASCLKKHIRAVKCKNKVRCVFAYRCYLGVGAVLEELDICRLQHCTSPEYSRVLLY
jgi:hypothetical protein